MTSVCHPSCKEDHFLFTHEKIPAQQRGVIAQCHTSSKLTSIPQTRNLVLVQKPQGQLHVIVTIPFPVSNLHAKEGKSLRRSDLEQKILLTAQGITATQGEGKIHPVLRNQRVESAGVGVGQTCSVFPWGPLVVYPGGSSHLSAPHFPTCTKRKQHSVISGRGHTAFQQLCLIFSSQKP